MRGSAVLPGLVLSSLVLSLSAYGSTATPADRLDARLAGLDTLHAAFEQRIEDDMSDSVSRGEMWLARPLRFRWEERGDYPQTLVSDGQTLWIWEPDLEQVTRQSAGEHLVDTPVQWLTGDPEQLHQTYRVELSASADGDAETFRLLPREAGSAWRHIELSFAGEIPTAVVLADALGQQVTIRLLDVEHNRPLDPQHFHFVPPAGVDVIVDQ